MKGLKLVAILLFAIPALISCETEKGADFKSENLSTLRDIIVCTKSNDGKVCVCCKTYNGKCATDYSSSFFVTECKYAEEFFIVE